MDYLRKPGRNANTTRRNHTLSSKCSSAVSLQYVPGRAAMYCLDRERAAAKSLKWRPQRVKTMYSLIHGGQGPHTIPFGLLNIQFQNCTIHQMDALVLTPSQYQQMMDDEDIIEYDADLAEYKKIYDAYKRKQREGKEIGYPIHTRFWGEYGWRQLGEMLVNRSPYATYHWREKINPRSAEGHALLAGKGTEGTAIREFRDNNGVISLETAIAAVDISSDHGFNRPDRLQAYLYNVLMQMVKREDVPKLAKIIEGMDLD